MPYDEIDNTARYAPSEVWIVSAGVNRGRQPVIRYVIHPVTSDAARRAAHIPILGEFVALECVTDQGSRFYGVADAWINSELRACVSGYSARDEIGPRNWAEAPSRAADREAYIAGRGSGYESIGAQRLRAVTYEALARGEPVIAGMPAPETAHDSANCPKCN